MHACMVTGRWVVVKQGAGHAPSCTRLQAPQANQRCHAGWRWAHDAHQWERAARRVGPALRVLLSQPFWKDPGLLRL